VKPPSSCVGSITIFGADTAILMFVVEKPYLLFGYVIWSS
jgi:hypothetical protein